MIRKARRFLAVCIFLAAMVFGIVKKQTYTDFAKQENYLLQISVAELPGNILEHRCAELYEKLPDSAIILRVRATGDIEHLFCVDRQKTVIQEVYAGTGVEQGDEVYITSGHWGLAVDGTPRSIARGFVNIMEAGTEYLVFAEGIMEDWETGTPVVKLYDNFIIAPMFSYEEHQNVVMPVSDGSTYVAYKDVKDNEFFATTEEALQTMERLKSQMLSLYPRDEID